MAKAFSLLACMVLGVIGRGCVVESDQPITALAAAKQEQGLYGVWMREDGKTVQYLHVGAEAEKPAVAGAASPEPGLMRMWLITHEKDDDDVARINSSLSMRFFVSKLGDDVYLNALLPLEQPTPTTATNQTKYAFLKCKSTVSDLTVYLLDVDATAAAVESGGLGGSVVREENLVRSVQITDSSEHIAAYLTSPAGAKLFTDNAKVEFHRLR